MRHRLTDAERIADRQHQVADLEIVGIGEFEGGEAFGRALDAQHREIAALILKHNIGVEFAFIGKRDLHLVGALDHMIICDDKSVRIDDDA